MKELSFQWRITLMTVLLIAAACIILNLLLFRSGSYYIEAMGEYVVEFLIINVEKIKQKLLTLTHLRVLILFQMKYHLVVLVHIMSLQHLMVNVN